MHMTYYLIFFSSLSLLTDPIRDYYMTLRSFNDTVAQQLSSIHKAVCAPGVWIGNSIQLAWSKNLTTQEFQYQTPMD